MGQGWVWGVGRRSGLWRGSKALTLRRSNGRPLTLRSRSDKLRTQRQGQGSSSGGGVGPRRTHRVAAGSQLLTLPRTSWDGATGSKEAPLGAGMGASPQQRQPAIRVSRGRLCGGPGAIPPRSPVLSALVASAPAPAPRDRKERIRVSLCHLGTGPTLGTWHSWLRGHMEGDTFSWEGDKRGGLFARGLSPGRGPGSRRHLCPSSLRAWGFCRGGQGVSGWLHGRELSLRGVVCRGWLCSWSQGGKQL